MARLFTDFSDSPAFTERWNTGDGVFTIETSGLPSGAGSHAGKIVMSASSRYGVSWDAAGTPSGDVEVVMKWLLPSASSVNGAMRTLMHGGGSAGSEDAYLVSYTISVGGTMVAGKYVAGTASNLTSGSQTGVAPVDTWLWTRVRRSGTTLYHRTWTDGAGEPGTWGASPTDASLSSGWVGFGSAISGTTLWFDKIGVGTGGDAAPASGNAARSIHQYRMRRAG